MAFYRGEEGSVKFKNSAGTTEAVAQTTSWSLDLTKDTLETTVHGDTSRSYVGSLISGTGSVEFNYTAASGNETKNLLDEVLVTEDAGDAQFELYIDTSGSKKWSFSGVVTGMNTSTSVGDLTTVTANFTTSGAITSAA
tara:strand:+ start:2482 stop:2898 length:417 start_codon:yes stop_codon:yes gene_type:complete